MLTRRDGVGFAGPTLYAMAQPALRDRGLRWLPPVRRGDVDHLVDTEPPQLLVIVDGQFQNCLSVTHREIRRAVDRGWDVWGIASMGAIRAYELRECGMHGFGEVYRRFFLEDDFRDDEVALLHEPEPPYRAQSEPLVHIRVAVDDLVNQGVLASLAAARVIDAMSRVWFGRRTLPWLRALLQTEVPSPAWPFVEASLASFGAYRIKSLDLEQFIVSRWPSARS